MPDPFRRGPVRTAVRLALAFAVLVAPAAAAETWIHPVLPQAGATSAPTAPRRGARPARTAGSPALSLPTAASGDSSTVELTSGERYPEPGGAVPPERIDRSYVRLGAARPMPLTSAKADGAVTRLEATWAGQGLATLAVLLLPEARTVAAAEFESFLREAGADAALAERAKRKETRKDAKVVVVESARAFAGVAAPPRTRVASDAGSDADAPLGLPLELVSSVPPLRLHEGEAFRAAVLLDGRPAPGAVVKAYAAGGGASASVTADAEGVVSLPLASEGRLLLSTASARRTVKADRSRGEAWKKADWEVRRTTLELLVLPKVSAPAPVPTRPARRPAPKPR